MTRSNALYSRLTLTRSNARQVHHCVPTLRAVGSEKRFGAAQKGIEKVTEIKPRPKDAIDLHEFFKTSGIAKRVAKYEAAQQIFFQGEAAGTVLYILEGSVKMSLVNSAGKEAVLALLGKGDFFGEGCMAAQRQRNMTAETIVDSTLIAIEKNEMMRALHSAPELLDYFLAHTLARNARIEEDLIDQVLNSSQKRLARTLLLLAEHDRKNCSQNIISKISQATLANMVGTTRSRISSFMNNFRKMGLLNYDRRGIQINEALMSGLLQE